MKHSLDSAHHSLNPASFLANSLIPLAYALARSAGVFKLLMWLNSIAAGHGLGINTSITWRGADGPAKLSPRLGSERGVIGASVSLVASASVLTLSALSEAGPVPADDARLEDDAMADVDGLSLGSAPINGGGVSRESISPISSIAPPSISARSFKLALDASAVLVWVTSSLEAAREEGYDRGGEYKSRLGTGELSAANLVSQLGDRNDSLIP